MLDRQHRTVGASVDEQDPQVIGIAGEDGSPRCAALTTTAASMASEDFDWAQSSPAARARRCHLQPGTYLNP